MTISLRQNPNRAPLTTSARVSIALVAVGLIVAAGVSYSMLHIPPITSLGLVELGMKEVDVTLVYGSRPDSEASIDISKKEMIYNTHLDPYRGRTAIRLRGRGNDARVSQICSTDRADFVFRTDTKYSSIRMGTFEDEVVKRLGDPASISVNTDGTSKWVNYPKQNLALELESGRVIEICVTSELVRYAQEYGQKKLSDEVLALPVYR